MFSFPLKVKMKFENQFRQYS